MPAQQPATAAAAPKLPADPGQKKPATGGDVTGTVTDTDGDAIPGAQVALTGNGAGLPRTVLTDQAGYFNLLNVPPGQMTLTVAAAGFATVARPVTMAGDQIDNLPDIALPVATANVDVEVGLSQSERAEIDIKTAETQRLVGFIPNFYVVYNWHAPPLTARQKFGLAQHTVTDPANIMINAGVAGIFQATNTFSGYGPGWPGYGKRFGANTADFTVGTMLGGAIFPVIFRQDPRYFYKGTGSVWSRTRYALSTAVICRDDRGRWRPNYSSVLGDVSAGAISNAYYPASNRNGATVTIESGLLNAAQEGVGNVLQEFLYKRFTPKPKAP